MKKIFLVLIVLGLFLSSSAKVSAAEKEFNMSEFIDVLVSAGVIKFDDIVKAKVWASDYDKMAKTPTASTTAFIQVLKPNNSDTWELSRTVPYEIIWGSQGVDSVHIALVSGKNNNCEINYEPIKINNGNHLYKILPKKTLCYNLNTATSTPLLQGSYKILIYGQDDFGVKVSDSSDSNVQIKPVPIPSLKVTDPNGGENLTRTINYDIKYSTSNFDKSLDEMIQLSLINTKGEVVYKTQKRFKDNMIYLDWPGTLSPGAYKVKLKVTDYKTKVVLEDESDDFFWLSNGY